MQFLAHQDLWSEMYTVSVKKGFLCPPFSYFLLFSNALLLLPIIKMVEHSWEVGWYVGSLFQVECVFPLCLSISHLTPFLIPSFICGPEVKHAFTFISTDRLPGPGFLQMFSSSESVQFRDWRMNLESKPCPQCNFPQRATDSASSVFLNSVLNVVQK